MQLKNAILRPADIDDELFMFYESTGQQPTDFEQVTFFDEDTGLAVVSVNMRFGAINRKGKVIIPLIYDKAMQFSEGLLAVKKNNKWGYVDARHQTIIPFMYDNLLDYYSTEEQFWINNGSVMGTAALVYCGKIQVAKDGKQGVINLKNETVLPFSSDKIKAYNEHFIILQRKEKQGVIDWQQEQVLPFKFSYLHLTTMPKYIGFGQETVINSDEEHSYDGILHFDVFNKPLIFGVMSAGQHIVIPPVSHTPINNILEDKALCYDAQPDDHFVYELSTARRIYAPADSIENQEGNGRINYLRNLMGMSAV